MSEEGLNEEDVKQLKKEISDIDNADIDYKDYMLDIEEYSANLDIPEFDEEFLQIVSNNLEEIFEFDKVSLEDIDSDNIFQSILQSAVGDKNPQTIFNVFADYELDGALNTTEVELLIVKKLIRIGVMIDKLWSELNSFEIKNSIKEDKLSQYLLMSSELFYEDYGFPSKEFDEFFNIADQKVKDFVQSEDNIYDMDELLYMMVQKTQKTDEESLLLEENTLDSLYSIEPGFTQNLDWRNSYQTLCRCFENLSEKFTEYINNPIQGGYGQIRRETSEELSDYPLLHTLLNYRVDNTFPDIELRNGVFHSGNDAAASAIKDPDGNLNIRTVTHSGTKSYSEEDILLSIKCIHIIVLCYKFILHFSRSKRLIDIMDMQSQPISKLYTKYETQAKIFIN